MGNLKKGAMFGLDARIALAIFGALSVISGAALYSAIQNAKATAVLTEVQNIVKSFEQYYLDRGSIPSDASTVSGYYNIHADVFLTNLLSENTWDGPYYSAVKRGGGHTADMEFSSNKGSYFLVGSKSYQQNSYSTWSTACRTYLANDKCFLGVTVKDLDLSLAKSIDKMVDGVDGYNSGNLRIEQSGNATTTEDATKKASIIYIFGDTRTFN